MDSSNSNSGADDVVFTLERKDSPVSNSSDVIDEIEEAMKPIQHAPDRLRLIKQEANSNKSLDSIALSDSSGGNTGLSDYFKVAATGHEIDANIFDDITAKASATNEVPAASSVMINVASTDSQIDLLIEGMSDVRVVADGGETDPSLAALHRSAYPLQRTTPTEQGYDPPPLEIIPQSTASYDQPRTAADTYPSRSRYHYPADQQVPAPAIDYTTNTDNTDASVPPAISIQPGIGVQPQPQNVNPTHAFDPSSVYVPRDKSVYPPTAQVYAPVDKSVYPPATTTYDYGNTPTGIPGATTTPTALFRQQSDEQMYRLPTERYVAWLPGVNTRRLLDNQTATLQTQLSLTPDTHTLDPIQQKLIQKGITDCKRNVPTINGIPHDVATLCKLIREKEYFLALLLTTILLSRQLKVITDYNLQIWYSRFYLMIKMEQYDRVDKELFAFQELDNPDMYYEFYPELHVSGSMVSFSFRLLHAQFPQFRMNFDLSLDRIFRLKHTIENMLKELDSSNNTDSEDTRKVHRKILQQRFVKVLYLAVNCTLKMKDYMNAIKIITLLKTKDTTNVHYLNSAMSRIYLQVGNIEKSKQVFSFLPPEDSIYNKLYMNSGLISIAEGKMDEACNNFIAIKNVALASNNLAVCKLYQGDLASSVDILSSTFRIDDSSLATPPVPPPSRIHESIAFNISTLYELETNNADPQKVALLREIATREGSSFSMGSVKLDAV